MEENRTNIKVYYRNELLCTLYDEDFEENSLEVSGSALGSSGFNIGGATSNQSSLTLTKVGLKKMRENNALRRKARFDIETFEGINNSAGYKYNLGKFYVTELTVGDYSADLVLYDGMVSFDDTISEEDLKVVQTTENTIVGWVNWVMGKCSSPFYQITLDTSTINTDMPNGGILFKITDDSRIDTYRNMLELLSVLAGGYFKIDRYGKLYYGNFKNIETGRFINETVVTDYNEDAYPCFVRKLKTSVAGFDHAVGNTNVPEGHDELELAVYENPFLRSKVTEEDKYLPAEVQGIINTMSSPVVGKKLTGGSVSYMSGYGKLGHLSELIEVRRNVIPYGGESATQLLTSKLLVTDFTYQYKNSITLKCNASVANINPSSSGLNKGVGYSPTNKAYSTTDNRLDEIAGTITGDYFTETASLSDTLYNLISKANTQARGTDVPKGNLRLPLGSIVLDSTSIEPVPLAFDIKLDAFASLFLSYSSIFQELYNWNNGSKKPISSGGFITGSLRQNMWLYMKQTSESGETTDIPVGTLHIVNNNQINAPVVGDNFATGVDNVVLYEANGDVGRYKSPLITHKHIGYGYTTQNVSSQLESLRPYSGNLDIVFYDEENMGEHNRLVETTIESGRTTLDLYIDIAFAGVDMSDKTAIQRSIPSFLNMGVVFTKEWDANTDDTDFGWRQWKSIPEDFSSLRKIADSVATYDIRVEVSAIENKALAIDIGGMKKTTVQAISDKIKSKLTRKDIELEVREIQNSIEMLKTLSSEMLRNYSVSISGESFTRDYFMNNMDSIFVDLTSKVKKLEQNSTDITNIVEIVNKLKSDVETIGTSITEIEGRLDKLEGSSTPQEPTTSTGVNVAYYYNSSLVGVSQGKTEFAKLKLDLNNGVVPVLNVSANASVVQNGTLTFEVLLDGSKMPLNPKFLLSKATEFISFSLPFLEISEGKLYDLSLLCSTEDSEVNFNPNDIAISVINAKLAKSATSFDEKVKPFTISSSNIKLSTITENISTTK